MPGMSSDHVRKHWRYDVTQEFKQVPDDPSHPAGPSATWATGYPHFWKAGERGGALSFTKFESPSEKWMGCSFNGDQTRLALIQGAARRRGRQHAILHLYDLAAGTSKVVNGKFGRSAGAIFSPLDSDLLITSAEADWEDDTTKTELLFWNLANRPSEGADLEDEDLRTAAINAVAGLSSSDTIRPSLSEEEQESLRNTLQSALTDMVSRRMVSGLPSLHGRICSAFDSSPFSRDGRHMIYQPGEHPDSNGRDDRWILVIRDVITNQDVMTLKGHTDGIMWVGWSHTDKWIMSISWDKTVRIWEASTGKEIWNWKTKNQNWTGSFGAPTKDGDAEWVIATCGDGTVHCWSLEDGKEMWRHHYESYGHAWTRAVAVSPTGRYVIVGGEYGAGIEILDLHRPMKDDVHREATTRRAYGVGGVTMEQQDEDEEEGWGPPQEGEDENGQKRPTWDELNQSMILGFLSISEIRFVDDYRFAWSSSVDNGLHVYDIRKNILYRWAPEELPRPADGQADRDLKRPIGLLGFDVAANGNIWTVHGDGVREWQLPV